jgi:hypothetical protein
MIKFKVIFCLYFFASINLFSMENKNGKIIEFLTKIQNKRDTSMLYFLCDQMMQKGDEKSLIVALMTVKESFYITKEEQEKALELSNDIDQYFSIRNTIPSEIVNVINKTRY